MAGIPYYSITPCCPDLGTPTGFFNIPDALLSNDVYVYNGPTAVVNGVLFISGFCYSIEYEGLSITNYNDAPTPATYTSADKTCNFSGCAECDSIGPYLFEVYACCDSSEVVTLNLDADFTTDAVYSYDGLVPFTVGGFTFEPNSCYQITFVGIGTGAAGPNFRDFSFQGENCFTTENCPDCPTTDQYLAFASCCSNTIVYLRPHSTSDYLEGVYEYLGTPVNGLQNICYSLTIHDVGVAPIDDIAEYAALPEAPAFVENVTFNTFSDINTNCADYSLECPSCKKPCYTLYSCDGIFFNTTVDMSAYVGTFVSISNSDGPIAGTWYVLVNAGNCNNAIEDITVDLTPPEPCDCRCFEVTGFAKNIIYINCDGELVKTFGSTKFCAFTYPFVTGTAGQYQVTEGGNCVDGECPILCYELTNCDTSEIIYSTLQSLSQYVTTSTVIQIAGYDGCWQVDISEEACDCPVNVIVVKEFTSCPDCLPIVAYKLTNCENSSDIKYTYQDLSLFVGEYIKTEDCGCFFVELIDFQPPSITTVVILTSFTSCPDCLRQYYALVDTCNRIEDTVYTYTDLSAYLGQIIKIQGCDTCWTVEETEVPINPGIVTVDGLAYETCEECTPPLPCLCNRMTNYSSTDKDYQYIDCNDNTINLKLGAGETSGKICVKTWVVDYPDTDNLEVFGECELTNTPDVYTCPIVTPKRKIKPGYSVPTCDTEKWENITCRSSEILYKQVMTLRYGISNCCPDEDDKWLIKKELIDLAALVDPDYVCAPVQSCGCPPSSCGCGCNSTLKTCNSQ